MKVTCSLPNASENINGIPFERQENGTVVSAGLSAEAAAQFAEIPGYVVEDESEAPAKTSQPAGKAKSEPAAAKTPPSA